MWAIIVTPVMEGGPVMNVLVIIYSDDAEAIYNAMRLANIGVEKGDEVSVFMLGKGVTFEQVDSTEFDVKGQIDQFEGDFYV
jgi:peroxiredoxin family protein